MPTDRNPDPDGLMTSDYQMSSETRPRTRRAAAKDERRRALIRATIRSIADNGLSGTTIARVTEIAGTSVGLANFHFENKERLFEAALQHLADEERAIWEKLDRDAALTPAERLVGLMDARFDARVCNRDTLSVWFAFWGDAGARDIYRRVVGKLDDDRLNATVAIIQSLGAGAEGQRRDPMQTALGLEAFYDGLWLNHLLYPADFKRPGCRQRALEHLQALFPAQLSRLETVAARNPGGTERN
jgi:TetR/AcrR family transcriptional regulator, transcriptional repressor of bet genes